MDVTGLPLGTPRVVGWPADLATEDAGPCGIGSTWTTMPMLPSWILLVATAALLVAAAELGHAIGRRRLRGGVKDGQEELGSLVGAMLGVLGFFLAIAFGGQLSRFDSSKSLMLEEATAIYEVFLRADMLPPEAHRKVRQDLRRYTEVRLDTGGDKAKRIRQSEALQESMWSTSIEAGEAMGDIFPKELYFDSLSKLIALHQKRVTVGIQQRMPWIIWMVLYALAVLAFYLSGYHGGMASGRRSVARPITALAFAMLVALVADLDDPGSGLLQLDEAPLRDVEARMEAHIAGSVTSPVPSAGEQG